jgi:hypothetical protein
LPPGVPRLDRARTFAKRLPLEVPRPTTPRSALLGNV